MSHYNGGPKYDHPMRNRPFDDYKNIYRVDESRSGNFEKEYKSSRDYSIHNNSGIYKDRYGSTINSNLESIIGHQYSLQPPPDLNKDPELLNLGLKHPLNMPNQYFGQRQVDIEDLLKKFNEEIDLTKTRNFTNSSDYQEDIIDKRKIMSFYENKLMKLRKSLQNLLDDDLNLVKTYVDSMILNIRAISADIYNEYMNLY